MSDDHKDVLIAAYLFEDLAQKGFDAILKLAEDKAITIEGVAVVQEDPDGEVHVNQTGDHLGRKGAKLGGGTGLVVGLFAPPLLAATAIGAAAGATVGKFAKHRIDSGIGEKLDAALPPAPAVSSRSTTPTAPTPLIRRLPTRSGSPSRTSTA